MSNKPRCKFCNHPTGERRYNRGDRGHGSNKKSSCGCACHQPKPDPRATNTASTTELK